MLCCDRINTWEGIDVNKSGRSKECLLFHYWYFLDTGYRYEPEGCNGRLNISMMFYVLKDIAVLTKNNVDYWCIIWNMSRSDAVNRLNNSKLDIKG